MSEFKSRRRPHVPLTYCDELPEISLPGWMEREREHVLVKQKLEIKSRYNDIKIVANANNNFIIVFRPAFFNSQCMKGTSI